jgi:hypothetical protein
MMDIKEFFDWLLQLLRMLARWVQGRPTPAIEVTTTPAAAAEPAAGMAQAIDVVLSRLDAVEDAKAMLRLRLVCSRLQSAAVGLVRTVVHDLREGQRALDGAVQLYSSATGVRMELLPAMGADGGGGGGWEASSCQQVAQRIRSMPPGNVTRIEIVTARGRRRGGQLQPQPCFDSRGSRELASAVNAAPGSGRWREFSCEAAVTHVAAGALLRCLPCLEKASLVLRGAERQQQQQQRHVLPRLPPGMLELSLSGASSGSLKCGGGSQQGAGGAPEAVQLDLSVCLGLASRLRELQLQNVRLCQLLPLLGLSSLQRLALQSVSYDQELMLLAPHWGDLLQPEAARRIAAQVAVAYLKMLPQLRHLRISDHRLELVELTILATMPTLRILEAQGLVLTCSCPLPEAQHVTLEFIADSSRGGGGQVSRDRSGCSAAAGRGATISFISDSDGASSQRVLTAALIKHAFPSAQVLEGLPGHTASRVIDAAFGSPSLHTIILRGTCAPPPSSNAAAANEPLPPLLLYSSIPALRRVHLLGGPHAGGYTLHLHSLALCAALQELVVDARPMTWKHGDAAAGSAGGQAPQQPAALPAAPDVGAAFIMLVSPLAEALKTLRLQGFQPFRASDVVGLLAALPPLRELVVSVWPGKALDNEQKRGVWRDFVAAEVFGEFGLQVVAAEELSSCGGCQFTAVGPGWAAGA